MANQVVCDIPCQDRAIKFYSAVLGRDVVALIFGA